MEEDAGDPRTTASEEALSPAATPAATPAPTPAAVSPEAAWTDEVTGPIAAGIIDDVFPSRRGSATFHAEMSRFVRRNVAAVAAASGQLRIDGERADLRSTREFGRWLAEQGFPLSSVRRAYWTGLRQMLDRWAKAGWVGLAPGGSNAAGIPGDVVFDVTSVALDMTEQGVRSSSEAHTEAADALRDSGDLRRRDLVANVLKGTHATASVDDTALRYRMMGFHVGVLIDVADRERAEHVLRKAQTATGARDRLMVPLAIPQWTGWLGYSRDVSGETLRTLRGVLHEAGVRTAVGGPRYGVEGFRRSYHEARRVEEMRSVLATEELCLSYRDFAFESVLLGDVAAASAFVADELKGLADDTARTARIRETLGAWLSSGSRTLTASQLGVHENTVRLRLNAAADILGLGYLERRTELLAALRLRRALGATAAQPDPDTSGAWAPADRRQ